MTKIEICFCHHVIHLKEYIQRKFGIKPERQELSLNGFKLEKEGVDIASLGVKKDSIIDLKILDEPQYENYFDYDYSVDDIKEKYKNELDQLNDMGYSDEEINIQVLKECSGNLQYAIEKLINLSG